MQLRDRRDLIFASSKSYTHSEGLSCAFRQWRADRSHCRFIHGYALEVRMTFIGIPNDCNWVMDFGGLKEIKQWLHETFDHTLLVARDDPLYDKLLDLGDMGLAQIRVVEATGCEAFATMIFDRVQEWLDYNGHIPGRVRINAVTVSEHRGNSASVFPRGASS
jgi:6-pyruvoyltetrahydropterin/6-carboxytetrahydropterin synthase